MSRQALVLHMYPQERLLSLSQALWPALHFSLVLCLQILPCPLEKVNGYMEESETQ